MLICSSIHNHRNRKKNQNGFFKRRFSYLYHATKPAGFLMWIFSFSLYKIRIMLVLMHLQIANYTTRKCWASINKARNDVFVIYALWAFDRYVIQANKNRSSCQKSLVFPIEQK